MITMVRKVTLEEWGVVAAILTFMIAVSTAISHLGQRYWRRYRIERYLIGIRRDNPDIGAMRFRRSVGQLAVELRKQRTMTASAWVGRPWHNWRYRCG